MNGDGNVEMIVTTPLGNSGRLTIYNSYSSGSTPPMTLVTKTTNQLDLINDRPALADFNSDGIAEVYVQNDIYQFDFSNPNAPTLKRVLNGTGHGGQFSASSKSNAVDILSPADCNGDPDCGGLEIVAGGFIYSVDMDPLDGDGLQIKVQRDLNQMTNMNFPDGYTHTADVNLDGVLDVIVLGNFVDDKGLYIWDKNGLIDFFPFTDPAWVASSVTINNVYDDRVHGHPQDLPEILFAVGPKLFCFNLNAAGTNPSQPYWWAANVVDESHLTSPSTFDLDGDGFAEVLFRDENEFRIMYGGSAPFPAGVDSERNYYRTDCFSKTIDEHPVIADVDMDGEAEILITGQIFNDPNSFGLEGRLWVFDSDDAPWVPARPVWNQYNYNGININDDLTIPKQQQANHLELPGIGSGKRPLNFVHSQMPIFDNQFDPLFPVPDAVVQFDSSQCETDSLCLWLTVCNSGSEVLMSGLPIAFYENDPTVSNATLLSTATTQSDIPIDGCIHFSINIPAVYNAPVFILVNDDGTLPTPFDLTNDFPITEVIECDYENNLTYFEIPYQASILDLGPDQSICNSSTVTLNAGNGFVKYRWQDGSNEPIFTAYEPGLYWVDVWDVCGFQQTDSVYIELDQVAAIDLGPDQTICEGGSVELSISGFPNVDWWPVDGLNCTNCPTVTSTPTVSTTYYVTASYGDCFSTDSVRVNVAATPAITVEGLDGICSGGAAVTVASNDGQVLDYVWENGETDETIHPVQTGNYSVTATNSPGCTTVGAASITITGGVELEALTTPVLCFDDSSASIQLEVQEGVAPFIFNWSNGATEEDLMDLPAGNYAVTVTDAEGCTAIESFNLTEPEALVVAPFAADISCNNDPGFISLHAGGGTSPLSVLWSNGAATDSINITGTGTYTATITDANGCYIESEHLMEEEEELQTSLELTDVKCHGTLDGQAVAQPLNGLSPYTFLWENGHAGSILIGIGTEQHTVTVTDAMGCWDTASFSLSQPDPLVLEMTSTDISCFGEMDGSAAIEVTGGVAGYSYQWNTGDTTFIIDGLPSGEYTVIITDANGCIKEQASLLTDPPELLIDPISINISCNNDPGFISLNTLGGTAPLSILWSNDEATDSINITESATYVVTVTDANGCSISNLFEIGAEEPLLISLSLTSITCYGDMDGQASVAPINGLFPYIYSWENGHADSLLTGLGTEVHAVTITDVMGCRETVSFNLIEPDSLVLNPSSIPVNCFGEMNGTASIEATGSEQNYHYLWNTAHNTPLIDGLSAGEYSVTVTDELGCVDSSFVIVGSPAPLEVAASAEPDSLCTDETTDLSASAYGGIAPYTYLWNGTQTDSFWLNAPTGMYDLLVTDANGCTQTEMLVVEEASPPITIADTIHAATGMGNADGAVFINEILGGTPPFTFLWSNGDTTQSSDNLLSGLYSLLITDAAGCIFMQEFEVGIMVATAEMEEVVFDVSLYPNPIGEMGLATLSIRSPFSQKIEVALFDVQGRRLRTEEWVHDGGVHFFLLKAPSVAGVYIVKVKGENGMGVYLKWVVAGK